MSGEWTKGFILQSDSFDQDGRHYLQFCGVGEQGPFELKLGPERVVFFIESSAYETHQKSISSLKGLSEARALNLKTMQRQSVHGLYFATMADQKEAREVLQRLGVRTYEADIKSHDRFLMERFLGPQISYRPQAQNYELGSSDYLPKLKSVSLDIETGQRGELYSVGLHALTGSEVLMVGEGEDVELTPGVKLKFFSDERQVLLALIEWFSIHDPDLILGWHVVGFDLKFLQEVARRYQIKLNLGRGRSELRLWETQAGRVVAHLKGRVVFDGPPLLRACFYKFSNFKLETVAMEVLGHGKDIKAQTSKQKIAEIERRFHHDKKALAHYNYLDCELVTEIFEKLGLIDLMLKRSFISGLMLDKVGLSTQAFDHFYLPKFHRVGFVAPNTLEVLREESAGGGFVLQPELGLHEHVVVFDFKSLYPSLIRTFKIDPYSRLMAGESDLSIKTPSGHFFSRENHILPGKIDELLSWREKAKREQDEALSQSVKILMNSFYGVMGASSCRFYHADLPEAITSSGQWVLKHLIKLFEDLGYKVIYGDTDSVFVQLKTSDYGQFRSKALELAQKMTQEMARELKTNFQVDSFLELQFDKYFRKIFMPPMRGGAPGAAKKRYVGMQVKDGQESLNFSGMEFVRSDWTTLAKKFQYQIFELMFQDHPLDEFIKKTIVDLKAGLFDDELVYYKKLSKPIADYQRQIPIHIRAAKELPLNEQKGLREIEYIITRRGPIPAVFEPQDIDYSHYIEKQLKPIAEDVLVLLGLSFDDIVGGDQLSLF